MARSNKNYESRKNELTKLAFDLFIRQGYENTTITHIMKAARLTKAGMYHYFSAKKDILAAAIAYGISRETEITLKNMAALSLEEKMILFVKGSAKPNEFLEMLLKLKQRDKDSYAAYRIREGLIHANIPIMEDILKEGIEKGIYKTDYPRQTAELLVLFGKALVEDNILPAVEEEELKLRSEFFLKLLAKWLDPDPRHMKAIIELFEQEFKVTYDFKETDK